MLTLSPRGSGGDGPPRISHPFGGGVLQEGDETEVSAAFRVQTPLAGRWRLGPAHPPPCSP